MIRKFTPRTFATFQARRAVEAPAKVLLVAQAVAENTKRSIRAVVGDQERLAPLAPSTVAEKSAGGYGYPEAPLYRTGQLRDSFELEVVPHGPGRATAAVGTENIVALYHELGTPRMPARPEVAEGALDAEEMNVAVFRIGASSIVADEPRAGAIVPRYNRAPAVPE